MGEMRSTVHIAAPPDRVFDFVDDWRNAVRYLHRLVRWEPVDHGATMGVGTVFRVGIQAGPTRLDGKLEVTDYSRPEKISIRSIDGPRVVGGWTFEPNGDGTRVSLRASFDLPGGIAGRLVGSFISRNGQRDLDESLRDLKRLVEATG
jgi:fatty-acyl-CoA synthase